MLGEERELAKDCVDIFSGVLVKKRNGWASC